MMRSVRKSKGKEKIADSDDSTSSDIQTDLEA